MRTPRRTLSRARGVLYETRTVLEKRVTSDSIGALDTTTSSLKAVEAVLLAATLTIAYATGWAIKFAVDGHVVLVAAVAVEVVVMVAAIAATQVTRAARDRLGEERRLHEEALDASLDAFLRAAGPGGCPNTCPPGTPMKRAAAGTVIEVDDGRLTDAVFAAVQAARGVPTGRHKRWSEHYVFDALDADQADAIARLLADADVSFTVEVTWAGGPAAATA